MGSVLGSSSKTKGETQTATGMSKVQGIVVSTPVVVFSKTYCAYSKKVKQVLSELGASYKAIELDKESDGSEMQSALAEWTGQKTVPNVFIGGKHIGGCDMVLEKQKGGQLVPLLTDAGAIRK
ncbi:glutaredoxin [Diospyros lotus]|uniref:glutaredoxin n=1 Tax=Diospyros lotus TaxID=55363 RepID=UPI0022527E6E|nr:glutaredoxin [Diospyros lotus]